MKLSGHDYQSLTSDIDGVIKAALHEDAAPRTVVLALLNVASYRLAHCDFEGKYEVADKILELEDMVMRAREN
jgi:hypothetical protein